MVPNYGILTVNTMPMPLYIDGKVKGSTTGREGLRECHCYGGKEGYKTRQWEVSMVRKDQAIDLIMSPKQELLR